jgi:ketosteroid isomerase-like protein
VADDDVAAVHDITRRFYAAVESGDLDEMTALWRPGQATLCIHPGFGPVRGTATVLRSWALVMAQASYVQYVLTDESVEVYGDTAIASCIENVLSAGRETPVESFDGGVAPLPRSSCAAPLRTVAAGGPPCLAAGRQLAVVRANGGGTMSQRGGDRLVLRGLEALGPSWRLPARTPRWAAIRGRPGGRYGPRCGGGQR